LLFDLTLSQEKKPVKKGPTEQEKYWKGLTVSVRFRVSPLCLILSVVVSNSPRMRLPNGAPPWRAIAKRRRRTPRSRNSKSTTGSSWSLSLVPFFLWAFLLPFADCLSSVSQEAYCADIIEKSKNFPSLSLDEIVKLFSSDHNGASEVNHKRYSPLFFLMPPCPHLLSLFSNFS
jgi:hypothetical protein